jgi:hypothetical protein
VVASAEEQVQVELRAQDGRKMDKSTYQLGGRSFLSFLQVIT